MNEKKHAKYGSPSRLYALEQCPAQVSFGKDIPDPPPSEYAAEGTVFHGYMEEFLPHFLTGKRSTVMCVEYPDMTEYVLESRRIFKEKYDSFCAKHTDVKIYYELQVKINEDIFGTSDVVLVGTNKKTKKTDVVALDWKYGQGVGVKAEENLQGIAYLIGAVKTLKLKNLGTLVVIIAQVRLEDGWSQYVIKADELPAWEKRITGIATKVRAIYEGYLPINGNMKAGSHCRFCKAKDVCPEQKKEHYDVVVGNAEELPLEDAVRKLTLDEQVEIFLKKKSIEAFLDAVAANLNAAFSAGVTHPKLKLIQKKGRRKWIDIPDEKIAKKLVKKGIKDPWDRKLIALTKAEKLCKNIDDLVEISAGATELVSVEDKRVALVTNEPQELPE